jgi:hypothetical protein
MCQYTPRCDRVLEWREGEARGGAGASSRITPGRQGLASANPHSGDTAFAPRPWQPIV